MKKTNTLKIIILSFSAILYFSCQSKTETKNIESTTENIIENNEPIVEKDNSTVEESSEPKTCADWIGFYGDQTREIEQTLTKELVKVKEEGFDKYKSADKLVGSYVLKNKNMPIEKVEILAKYLAYELCLSDNKKFNGVLMNCESRKIQVAIARTNEKYSDESWAVVYNIFPGNKKGESNKMDY